jgi:hypothetical protein
MHRGRAGHVRECSDRRGSRRRRRGLRL